jgi:hypothetical protein
VSHPVRSSFRAGIGGALWNKNFKKDYAAQTPVWGFADMPSIEVQPTNCIIGGRVGGAGWSPPTRIGARSFENHYPGPDPVRRRELLKRTNLGHGRDALQSRPAFADKRISARNDMEMLAKHQPEELS